MKLWKANMSKLIRLTRKRDGLLPGEAVYIYIKPQDIFSLERQGVETLVTLVTEEHSGFLWVTETPEQIDELADKIIF